MTDFDDAYNETEHELELEIQAKYEDYCEQNEDRECDTCGSPIHSFDGECYNCETDYD